MAEKNVLVLVLNSLRKDRLSIYNEKVNFTPSFEELANSAVSTNAYAEAPWTLPSTDSIFTGKHPLDHGTTNQKKYVNHQEKLLPEIFQESGYQTKRTTSNVWLPPSSGMDKGFDEVENFLCSANMRAFKTISKAINHVYNKLSNRTRREFAEAFNGPIVDRVKICN